MQLDLFSDQEVCKKCNRLKQQIQTRQFEFANGCENFKGIAPYLAISAEGSKYYAHLQKVFSEGKHITTIGACASDTFYCIEELGIGKYRKKYTTILDMSNCLDLVMGLCFQSDVGAVRRIKNYDLISAAIMNADFSQTNNLNFEVLTENNPELENWLANEASRIANTCCEEELLQRTVARMYTEILQTAANVKFYAITAAGRAYESVIRSTSYSSILATSLDGINDCVTIRSRSGLTYDLELRSYLPFAILEERLKKI